MKKPSGLISDHKHYQSSLYLYEKPPQNSMCYRLLPSPPFATIPGFSPFHQLLPFAALHVTTHLRAPGFRPTLRHARHADNTDIMMSLAALCSSCPRLLPDHKPTSPSLGCETPTRSIPPLQTKVKLKGLSLRDASIFTWVLLIMSPQMNLVPHPTRMPLHMGKMQEQNSRLNYAITHQHPCESCKSSDFRREDQ